MLLLITASVQIPANVGPILPWKYCTYLTMTLTLTLNRIPHVTLIPALILTQILIITLILTLTLFLILMRSQAYPRPKAYPSSPLSTDEFLLFSLLTCYL